MIQVIRECMGQIRPLVTLGCRAATFAASAAAASAPPASAPPFTALTRLVAVATRLLGAIGSFPAIGDNLVGPAGRDARLMRLAGVTGVMCVMAGRFGTAFADRTVFGGPPWRSCFLCGAGWFAGRRAASLNAEIGGQPVPVAGGGRTGAGAGWLLGGSGARWLGSAGGLRLRARGGTEGISQIGPRVSFGCHGNGLAGGNRRIPDGLAAGQSSCFHGLEGLRISG